MSKKDFIALADYIRSFPHEFNKMQTIILADFCQSQNPNFKRDRWLAYVAGECGPNGGRK